MLSKPRFKQLLALANAGAASVALSFANAALLIRLLGADTYGQYVYLVAITAVIPTFYETFNRTVVRFSGKLAPRRQLRLVLFVLAGKTAMFILVTAIFLTWFVLLGDAELESITAAPAFRVVFVLSILSMPVKLVGNVFRSVLNAQQRYTGVAFLLVLPLAIPVLINAWLLAVRAPIDVVLRWVGVELMVTPVAALIISVTMLYRNGWLGAMRRIKVGSFRLSVAFAYQHYFRKYGQPLATGIIFQYVKTNLPVVLLGNVGTFTNVAYYRLFSSIADIGADFFPTVFNAMLPSVVASRERDEKAFAARFTQHGVRYLLLMGAGMAVFILLHPAVLYLYGLAWTPEAAMAALLVGFIVMQASFGFLLNYLFVVGGDTRANYVMSPAHNIFYALLIVTMVPYLLIGMLWARIIHRMFGNAMLWYVLVVRQRCLTWPQFRVMLGTTFGFSAGLVAAYFLSVLGVTWR